MALGQTDSYRSRPELKYQYTFHASQLDPATPLERSSTIETRCDGALYTEPAPGYAFRANWPRRTIMACLYCRQRKIRCSGFQNTAEGKCQNCYWRKQECIFQPISTDVSGAVLKSVITNHIHQENRKTWMPGPSHLVGAASGQGFRVATMPPFSQASSIHHAVPLPQVPFFVYSRADMEEPRPAKRRKTMQERSVNRAGPAEPKASTARAASLSAGSMKANADDAENAKENNKRHLQYTGILTPPQTAATLSTSPVRSETSERPYSPRDDPRPKLQPKSRRLPAPHSSSTASVMSLSNLVNDFDAVAGRS
ncbi:kinetochore protein fta4 [Purpureocillium lavendulum]|uniref:Kinetochore protein fta4 n=1 Tax=Purpureocillium lavendulum TaxID=1247861 RepID=A0AB34FW53_9HYPO|nr:kinetochore protein fta4 [Purpureocillium lavendulum]